MEQLLRIFRAQVVGFGRGELNNKLREQTPAKTYGANTRLLFLGDGGISALFRACHFC